MPEENVFETDDVYCVQRTFPFFVE